MKDDLAILTLCHILLSKTKKCFTPLSLALAITLHHDTGSKQLIDMLHSLGICVSYEEVRRFETCVAKAELIRAEDVYIPDGIRKPDSASGIGQIHASIDNFNEFENTIDGKSNTHALVTVLFQSNAEQTEEQEPVKSE